MVSKPFVCENNLTAGGIRIEELTGNFGHQLAYPELGTTIVCMVPHLLRRVEIVSFPAAK